jgi:hypothetical protein
MNDSPLLAPQLITGARMLYLVWIPEDPSAVTALVPKELRPEARRSVFMNQYVVDSAEQTSNAGPCLHVVRKGAYSRFRRRERSVNICS